MAKNNTVEIVLKLTQQGSITKAAEQYGKGLSEMKKETGGLQKAFKTLNMKGFAQVGVEALKLRHAFDKIKAAYKEGKISTLELYAAQGKLKSRLGELRAETNNWKQSLMSAKAGLASLVGVGYMFVKSFGAYEDFTTKMAAVRTLVQASDKDFDGLKESIRGLTEVIPQSAAELAAAEYDIISAGIKMKDSVNVLKLSAQAAVAGMTDTKTAANVGIGVLNAYGLSTSHLGEVYDDLFMTVKKGVTTFPELAQSIGYVLPFAAQAGISIKELGAAIATLTKSGIKTPEATTALAAAFRALSMPTAMARKEMKKLGITWKGLIPTLKELTKYTDNPELLQKLIPDVRAQVAILTLAKHFKGLNETLGEFQDAAGATQVAYVKMEDTPENQIKMFKNAVNELQISLGSMLSKGLLPVVKGLTYFINTVKTLDPVNRAFIEILFSGGAAFILWQLGLGKIIFALRAAIVQLSASSGAVAAFTTEITLLKVALAGGIIISFVLAGYNLVRLIGEMKGLHDILKANHKQADNYLKDAQKYKSAKDIIIKSAKEVIKMSEDEKQAYIDKLKAAQRYWGALRVAATFESDKGKENAELIKKYDAKWETIIKTLHSLQPAAAKAASAMKEAGTVTAGVLQIAGKNAVAFKNALKKAYNDAISGAKRYADKVKLYESQIRMEKMSTADLIRKLQQGTMTDEQAWADQKKQADQKMAKAEEELHKGNYTLAKRLTEDAKGLYAGLAREVTGIGLDGSKQIVQDLKTNTDTAVNSIQTAGSLMEKILSAQKTNAEGMVESFSKKAAGIKKIMSDLIKPGIKKITINMDNLATVQNEIYKLSKPAEKILTIIEKHVIENVIKKALGGQLPGYGGGDIVPALLEPGEYIVRKEAVNKYGNILDRINALRFQGGGLIGKAVQFRFPKLNFPHITVPKAYAAGGLAAAAETININLGIGNRHFGMTTDKETADALIRHLKRMDLVGQN